MPAKINQDPTTKASGVSRAERDWLARVLDELSCLGKPAPGEKWNAVCSYYIVLGLVSLSGRFISCNLTSARLSGGSVVTDLKKH